MRMFLVLLFICNPALANTTLSQINGILAARRAKTATKQVFFQQHMRAITGKATIKSSVQRLKGKYEFVLFYRATCPHCRRFDPVLRQYSSSSGIPVKAFTFGGISPYFPNSITVDRDVIANYFKANMKVAVPTVFILNVTNGHAYPVSSGELTYFDFTARMNQLAPKILEFEGRGHA